MTKKRREEHTLWVATWIVLLQGGKEVVFVTTK